MPHTLTPRQISPAEFSTYTASWRQLLADGNIDALNACFMNSGTRLNYAYLLQDQVTSLLSAGTGEICSKFALAPRQSDGTPVFTIIFYSDDENATPASGFHLSGMAGEAAVIQGPFTFNESLLSCIPFEDAADVINKWDALPPDGLAFRFFDIKDERLRGYSHSTNDFKEAMMPPSPPALWFDFSLHPERGADDDKLLFDTVLTRNVVPEADAAGTITLSPSLLYYDVANPCPPACGIIDRV